MKAARLLGAQESDLTAQQYARRNESPRDAEDGPAARLGRSQHARAESSSKKAAQNGGTNEKSEGLSLAHNIDLSDVALAPGDGPLPTFLRGSEREASMSDSTGGSVSAASGSAAGSVRHSSTTSAAPFLSQYDGSERQSFSSGISPTTRVARLDSVALSGSSRLPASPSMGGARVLTPHAGIARPSSGPTEVISSIDPPLTRPQKRQEEISPFLFQEDKPSAAPSFSHRLQSASRGTSARSALDPHRASAQSVSAASSGPTNGSSIQGSMSSISTSSLPQGQGLRASDPAAAGAQRLGSAGSGVADNLSLDGSNSLLDLDASPRAANSPMLSPPISPTQQYFSQNYTSSRSSFNTKSSLSSRDKRSNTSLNPLKFFRKRTDTTARDENVGQLHASTSRSNLKQSSTLGFDEAGAADGSDSKKRRTLRPQKAEKDNRKSRVGASTDHRASTAATFSSPFAAARQQQSGPTVLPFDLNIEDINDFVDTTKRKTSLVGPKDERLSMSEAAQDRRTSAGTSTSPSSVRTTQGPSTAGHDAMRRASLTPLVQQALDAPDAQRPPTIKRLATTTGSTYSADMSIRSGASDATVEPIAEPSEMLASGDSALWERNGRQRPLSGSDGLSKKPHLDLSRDDINLANRHFAEHHQDLRQGSHTSASSNTTGENDLSPSASVANFNKTSPGTQRAATHLPMSARPVTGEAAAHKADATSGSKPITDWSAPDSWAVQPNQGKLQDLLRDADEDGQEDSENSEAAANEDDDDVDEDDTNGSSSFQPSAAFRGLGQQRPSTTASMMSGFTSGSGALSSERSDSVATAGGVRDYRSGRRGTIDSVISGSMPVGQDRGATTPRGEDIEETAHASTAASAQLTAARGTSRAAIANAAGKIGLHRPHRQKTGGSRPGTADKTNARPSLFSTATGDDSVMRSFNSKRHQSSANTVRNTFIRIWRDDSTHTVTQISTSTTTADLRVTLARKFGDSTGACNLYVRDKGSERPLGELEKPAQLQRRRLEQAGYKDVDSIDDLGREDLSFLIKFVFRPDRTPYFDPNAFGNTEADFNVLDLRKQNLEMVPIFLYRHAEWIKSLNLSGNPMRAIPSDFVQLCANLSTLCLSQLALKRIPQSIKQAKRLTHLDISDNRIAELWHIDLSEISQLMSLKVQNNVLSELPAYFEHMQTLRDLNISNNRFETFPVVICKASALSQLDASFNTIAAIPCEIGELKQLQRLVLVGNSIVELPPCIEALVNLQAIDVRRNLLVSASSLFALPKLEMLQCQHNAIRQLDVTFGARLRTLEIGNNPLSRAVFKADDMCALTTLNLSSADISKLDSTVLSNLPRLTELILNKNNMLALPDNLGSLTQLRRLSCTHNNLASLPESIGALANLVELQVQDNNLPSLPSSIWMCGKLETINVSSNVLESFPKAPPMTTTAVAGDAVAGSIVESRKTSASSINVTGAGASSQLHPLCSSLSKLRLADNRLTEDIFDVVSEMTELRVLNLSYNSIYELPHYGLRKLTKLRELYLSGNTIGSIPADELPLLGDLRTLHLNGNRLQTLPAELGQIKQLVNLDVGRNHLRYNISNQQYDWNWNSNPNLRSLNLSGNKRLEIKSNPVIVSGPDHPNGLKRTDRSDFQRLTELRLLGLMDVTVTLHQMPDEFHDRRVRTSLSQINQMSYGISDALGQHDHLSIIDVVLPRFRKLDNECLFGLFSGRGHSDRTSSRIAYHLAQWVNYRVQHEVGRFQEAGSEAVPLDLSKVPDIMRRAFLRMQKEYADMLLMEHSRKMDKSAAAENLIDAQLRCGAASVLAYVVDRTLFVANVGDALAVLSRNGDAVLISTKHEPFDRKETLRIRSAEGWVSLHGQVNDALDVSRGFGYYKLEPVVNSEPAVSSTTLTDSDEFVILANNTLWDYIPHQTAVDIARMERDDPMLAAQKLRDYAIGYGAEGSIMVMVVAVGDLFNKTRVRGNGMANGANAALRLNDPSAFEPQFDGYYGGKTRRRRDELGPIDRTLARLQQEVPPPIGHVALVFTDIRNSTALWESNDGMARAWRQHNTLVRRQLRSIGGYEVKNEGDAFMLSFQSVTSALYFCFQVQIGLLKENWPSAILESDEGKEIFDEATGELTYRGLSVRMGIHWGAPVCEADPITRRMDYFGPMVNRAARIQSAAEGGQIFVSRDVVSELRAIMGSVESDNKKRSATDGSNHSDAGADGDDPPEVPVGDDEDKFRPVQDYEGRDVVLLRRMGFVITEVGERSLKGLETPELLSLVYPKCLSPRFGKFLEALEAPRRDGGPKTPGVLATPKVESGDPLAEAGRRLNKHKPAVQVFEPTQHLLSVEDVKALGYICLRLEALAQGKVHEGVSEYVHADQDIAYAPQATHDPQTNAQDALGRRTSSRARALPPAVARQMAIETHLHDRPELQMLGMRDEATDEELEVVLRELSGRIGLALSSLSLRRFVHTQQPSTGKTAFGSDLIDIIDMLQHLNMPSA